MLINIVKVFFILTIRKGPFSRWRPRWQPRATILDIHGTIQNRNMEFLHRLTRLTILPGCMRTITRLYVNRFQIVVIATRLDSTQHLPNLM